MKYDIAIIGAGPGGYAAALRAGQLGMKVLLVERRRVGGVCLNEGCIPTKALLHSAHHVLSIKKGERAGIVTGDFGIQWERVQSFVKSSVDKLVSGVEYLLEKTGVDVIKGHGKLIGPGKIEVGKNKFEAKWIILATGSKPVELSFLPFGGRVLTSSRLMFFSKIPHKLLIIGAGAIGLEMATAFSLFGSEVQVVEALSTPLGGMDRDMSSFLLRALRELGIEVFLSSYVEKAEHGKDGVRLVLKDGRTLEGEYVLVSVGRRPNSEEFSNLLDLDDKGFVKTDESLKTSLDGVYAIGDLAGPPLLAHKAHHDAIYLVEKLAGLPAERTSVIPYAVFTEPEFAAVGLREEEARKMGLKYRKFKFPMGANGRAVTMGEEVGVVKILAEEDGRLLGVQILGPYASETIAEVSLAMKYGLKAHQLAEAVHVHPTISEALMEAAMATEGRAIHILNR